MLFNIGDIQQAHQCLSEWFIFAMTHSFFKAVVLGSRVLLLVVSPCIPLQTQGGEWVLAGKPSSPPHEAGQRLHCIYHKNVLKNALFPSAPSHDQAWNSLQPGHRVENWWIVLQFKAFSSLCQMTLPEVTAGWGPPKKNGKTRDIAASSSSAWSSSSSQSYSGIRHH